MLPEARYFFDLNASNCNAWAADGCSDATAFIDTNNWIGVDFALGGVDGADTDIVGTCSLSRLGLLKVVSAETDPFMGCIPAFSGFFDAAILLSEVYSIGIYFDGGFKVVIDDEGI